MGIKNKIKNLLLFIAIIICGLFLFGLNSVQAQEADWNQVNTDGFDSDTNNRNITGLVAFRGNMYAGTQNIVTGSQLWRSADGETWSEIADAVGGFGNTDNLGITTLKSFDGYLYAGTLNTSKGLELWRSSNGTSWSAIVATGVVGASYNNGFGNAGNVDSLSMEVYNSYLYLSTWNGVGGEIWRTIDGTTWSQINASGFGIAEGFIDSLEIFSGDLYASTGIMRGEIWNCDSCNAAGDWNDVVGDGPPSVGGGSGFGDVFTSQITKLINFGSNIYAGTARQIGGGEIYRSSDSSTWDGVVGGGASVDRGFGDTNNVTMVAANVSNDYLYFGTINATTGTEIWSTLDGVTWTQANDNGFGDSGNSTAVAIEEYENHLYVGTRNFGDGGELWQLNYIPEGSALTAVQSDDGDGKVTLSFAASDEESDTLSAQVQYNIGSGWSDPTISTTGSETSATSGDPSVNNSNIYQLSSIATPAVGNTITTTWNSRTDEDSVSISDARVRVRYTDGISVGNWITSANFSLDNTTPNAPTLDDVESPTNIDTQTISGGKDANTSVYLRDSRIVDINGSTSWSYAMDLSEGTNNLVLTSRDSGGNESDETTGSIILDTTAPTTTADPEGDTYVGILDEVTLNSDEAGTTIYYTLDGSDPDLDSDTYSDPFEIADNTTLKFFGVDSLDNQETINEEVYVLVDAAVRLTKSVSVESAESFAAAPFEFKYSGLAMPSISDGLNNLKAIAYKSLDFIKYPSYELYQRIAKVLLILLVASFGIFVSLALFKKIKNKDFTVKSIIGSFEFVYSSHKKLFFGLAIFISMFALSESLIAVHMLTAADAEVERGDTLIYQIDYQNIGAEDVREFYFVDSIPSFTEYITGSMQINDIAVTDASDFDNADYNSTWAGHTYFNIGDLDVGASGNIKFRVRVSDSAVDGSIVSNKAVGGYNPGSIRVESNTVSNNVSVESADEESSDDDTSSDDTSDTSSTTSRTTDSRGGSTNRTTENTGDSVSSDNEDSSDSNVTTDTPDDDSFIGKNGNNSKNTNNSESTNQIIEEKMESSFLNNLGTINKFAIAPILGLFALLNLFSTFSLSSIIPFLRYLWQIFTEPLLYFGKGKRKGWGVVYNSQTKQPIDLALVRLYNKKTKKLIETKVTDFEGRYIFVVESGVEYYLEVQKSGYSFPSKMLASVESDNNYKDIYHGEIVSIDSDANNKKEQGYIAYDIPIDVKEGVTYNNEVPHKPIKTDIRNAKELEKVSDAILQRDNNRILGAIKNFKIHKVLAYIGPILGLISFIFTPSWITFGLLILHLVMLIFFVMLVRKKEDKPFGKVYNMDNSNPLSKSVVRLFDSKYGRLLATTVSRSDGRYGFLVGDNKYLLNSNKQGFTFPKGRVEIVGNKDKVIKEDLGMKRE